MRAISIVPIISFCWVLTPSAHAFQTFEDFISARFALGDPENVKEMHADPDADGRDNFSEYLTGSDPRIPNANPLQVALSRNGSETALSFDTLTDRKYVVEYSTDLLQWDSVDSAPISGNGSRANLQHSGNSVTKGFYRVAISLPPIHVKKDAAGLSDGSNWANAFTDLQPAIDAARTGQEIWVSAGTYNPTAENPLLVEIEFQSPTPRTRTFVLKEGISILGGFNGTETRSTQRNYYTNRTILSGDLNNNDQWPPTLQNITSYYENSAQVIYALGLIKKTKLDGLEVKGGFAALINDSGQFEESILSFGGGMVAHGSNIEINNCLFTQNIALENGGAIFAYSGPINIDPQLLIGSSTGKIRITNSTFRENLVPDFTISQLRFVGGGAIYLADNYTGDFEGVTFDGNSAPNGGAIFMEYFGNSRGYPPEENALSPVLRIISCEFRNNSALCGAKTENFSWPTDGNGGAIYANNRAEIYGSRLLFEKNSALANDFFYAQNGDPSEINGGGGGALKISDGAIVKISASLFTQNYADWDGAGISASQWSDQEKPSLEIYFSLIYNNSAKWGAGISNHGADVSGFGNILNENYSLYGWNSDLGNTIQVNSISNFSYSLFTVMDGYNNGVGNLEGSADFVNPQNFAGEDGIAGTADDGFILSSNSLGYQSYSGPLPSDFADLDNDGDTSEHISLDAKMDAFGSAPFNLGPYQ